MYENLIKLCNEEKITLKKLIKETKVGTGLYDWDIIEPSVYKIKKVAEYFDVSIDYLMGTSELKRQSEYYIKNKRLIKQLENNYKKDDVNKILKELK